MARFKVWKFAVNLNVNPVTSCYPRLLPLSRRPSLLVREFNAPFSCPGTRLNRTFHSQFAHIFTESIIRCLRKAFKTCFHLLQLSDSQFLPRQWTMSLSTDCTEYMCTMYKLYIVSRDGLPSRRVITWWPLFSPSPSWEPWLRWSGSGSLGARGDGYKRRRSGQRKVSCRWATLL